MGQFSLRLLAIAIVGLSAFSATAQSTFNQATGNTWNSATNWTPNGIPDATGAYVVFNDAATANNPAQTANRTVTLDGAKTVGTMTFNNDAANTFTNTISTGTGGPLTFDATGTGPAYINVPAASGTGNNTISVATVFTDDVVAQVDQTTASSAAGALNLTTAISGPGGMTKNGDGLMTYGSGAKTYTGPTFLNGGRTRVSSAANPSSSATFTINSGGQLNPISGATYALGAATLYLNGNGATTGPFASFPGAIRPDTGLAVTISNNSVELQSDTVLHSQASAGTGATATPTGSLTLSGVISGPGKLTLTAGNSNIDVGNYVLTGHNTYTGGTLVAGGVLRVSGATAHLGSGTVEVNNASSPSSIARMEIQSGVTDAIGNDAILKLAGGGAANAADQNFIILGSGVNEQVGGLVLGGVVQTLPGTYGATGSGATFVFDDYFSGTGVVTLPEPGSAALFFGVATLVLRRRNRRG